VTRTAASLPRHPELVSGSIAQSPLCYRWHSQPSRQIHPIRVRSVNQVDLPRAVPILQLLLPRNRCLHRAKNLKMHQSVNCIFGNMSRRQTVTMLRQALEQVGSHADVQRTIKLACKYIYARSFLVSHALDSAAKWTLKQVQGDDLRNQTRYFTKIDVTLNWSQGPSSIGQSAARSTHD